MSEPLTRFTESEAILFAVREDKEGLAEYLADEDRFFIGELRRLESAALRLADACSNEQYRREHLPSEAANRG
jgi:hypothetical protein